MIIRGTDTLRQWLTGAGYDHEKGTLIVQPRADYWDDEPQQPQRVAQWDDPLLDEPFDSGFGGAEHPHFVAYDDQRIYFPGVYDGASWITNVAKDPNYYLSHKLPEVGGG
jgi:hypothetical protein